MSFTIGGDANSSGIKDKKGCTFSETVTTSGIPAYAGSVTAGNNDISSTITKTGNLKLDVKVMPNPSENYFTLTMSSISNAPVSIRVLYMYGKVLYTANGSVKDNYRFGASFVSGAYLEEFTQGSEKKNIKVVKG